MQRFRDYLYLVIVISLLVGCSSGKTPYFLPAALGDSFELVIVKPENTFSDRFYTTFIKFLTIDIGPAPQQENILSIVEVNDKEFTGLLQRHKNLLFIIQDDNFSIQIKKNLYAKDQSVIIVKCPSYDLLITKEKQIKSIVNSIKEIEFDRWESGLKSSQKKEIETIIKNTHGIIFPVPKTFFLAYADSDITWIRRETNKISQGVLVVNCKNNSLFADHVNDSEIEEIILNTIDSIVNRHVEGSINGSFMKTDRGAPRRLIKPINDNKKYILQSLWHMENDFMGGVYVANFLQNGQLIYMYVYAPGEEKRISLLQLESMVSSVRVLQ